MNVSLLKAGTYSVMHLLVAIAVAYALTGNVQAALAIGFVEPVFQTFAFALHDRFWAKRDGRCGVVAQPSMHSGCGHGGLTLGALRIKRPFLTVPVLKTLSYGAMHMVVAVMVAYGLTRSWRAALAIGLIEPVVQTVAFTLHDKAWARHDGRGGLRTAPSASTA